MPDLGQSVRRGQHPLAARCPNREAHTPCPEPYLAWHEWAEEMSKTHRQEKCPKCGLWAIWKPKEHQPAVRRQGDG